MPLRFIALAVLAAVLGGCGKLPGTAKADAKAAPPQALLVSPEDVVTVRNSTLASGPAITGTIQPERRADLRAEVQAVVLQVLKENGHTVHRGDLLVRLDSTAIRDALASAEAAERAGKLAFEQADRQYERMKTLRASGMASAQALDDAEGRRNSAQSDVEGAKARLVLARQQLARTEVRADVPGIVVYKDVFFASEQRKPQVGDQVWANQPLLILPDISKMVVETKIRETDIHKVEKNQRVSIRVEAYPDLRLTGAVTLVGTLAQEEKERRGTKFFGVTIQIKESEPRLRPGMTARVEIQVEERAEALYVPLEAVFERDGRSFCYLASGRRLEPREVWLGPSNQDFVVVEKGLRKGDRVCLREPGAPPSDFGSLTQP